MDPLSALSVASAVIQIVDFSSRVLARTKEIHSSTNDTIEETSRLQAATENLDDLLKQIRKTSHFQYDKSGLLARKTADEHLMKLGEESQAVAANLRDIITKMKTKKDGRNRNVFDHGVRSVLEQKKVSGFAMRLDQIRKEVDTSLLVILQQSMSDMKALQIQINNNTSKQKVNLLESVKEHNWKPTEQKDLADFSSFVMSSVESDLEQRFIKMILDRLYFTDMPDRHESIPKAHQETFQWLFESDPQQYNPDDWDNFTDWLTSSGDQNLFWATGKSGSEKSTLMKFLFDDERTATHLRTWSGGKPLVKARFFFWNSGTVMQMSRMGMLQSILHTVLSEDKLSIPSLFKQRWEEFIEYGGGRQDFTWAELRQVLEKFIATPATPRNFFFMIDGLDKFDGDLKELTKLVLDIAKYSHVKVCVASRPWLVFNDDFENCPTLSLERLTRNDIRKYVSSHFADNKHFKRLSKLEPDRSASLINEIAMKAAGVFLWVHLVVKSLLDGLSNADRISDLEARLDTTPPSLEELYDKLLRSLDANYFKHACQLFRLVVTDHRPLLINLYFADNEKDDSAMSEEVKEYSQSQIEECLEIMQRRLKARCKGFLETEDWHTDNGSVVGWIHRTGRDFLQSEEIWASICEATGNDSFDPVRRWANGHMRILKRLNGSPAFKWSQFTRCIHWALMVELQTGACLMAYLDEVGSTASQNCPSYRHGRFAKRTGIDKFEDPPELQNFLDFAVWYGMGNYVHVKAPSMTREALVHAAQYRGLSAGEEAPIHGRIMPSSRPDKLDGKPSVEEELAAALSRHKKAERQGGFGRVLKRVFR